MNITEIKALSIQQPYAWLISHGYQNIENREWGSHYRGWLLIHASSTRKEGVK